MKQAKTQMRVIYLNDITHCSDNSIIIRPPKDEEIRKAGTNPSDYQMGRIKYTSKILSDLELLPDVYNSKKAVIEKSNGARAKKILSVIEKISQFFDKNVKINEFLVELSNSTKNLHQKYEIFIPSLLYGAKNWSEVAHINKDLGYCEGLMMRLGTILRNTYGADRNLIQQQYNAQASDIFKQNNEFKTAVEITGDKNYEPTQEEVDRMKRIYIKTLNFFNKIEKTGNFSTPVDYVNYLNAIDSLNAILNEELMRNFVHSDNNITVGEYINQIKTYINSVKTDGERGNTMTVMMDITTTNLKEMNETLIKNGYIDGIKNIANFFEYIKIYKPYLVDNLSKIYGLDENMLSEYVFPTYESFFAYLYTPEMIKKIDSIVYKVKRARTKDSLRKGAELAVDYALYEKRKNIINERIENPGKGKRGRTSRTIEEIEELIIAKKEERENLRTLLLSANDEKSVSIKAKIAELCKNIASLKNTIKKRRENGELVIKSDKEKISDIDDIQKSILNKVRNRISSASEMFDLKNDFDYKENILSGEDAVIGGDMYTFSFIVKTKKSTVINTIIEILNETFNPDGSKPYNIDAYPYESIENGNEVIVDYHKSSAIFKMFAAKPELAFDIIKLMKIEVARRIAINPVIISDEEYVKINDPFDFITLN